MICKECGRVMPDTDKFCGRCGTPNPLFENADVPVQEQQPYANENSVTAQQYQPYTQPYTESVQEQPPHTQENTEPVQEQQPHPQVNDSPVHEYRPHAQTVNEPTDMKMSGGKAKVKYTCSLTAVIICVVVIFILSVACGVFAGLYFSVRPAAIAPVHSITQYESGGEV